MFSLSSRQSWNNAQLWLLSANLKIDTDKVNVSSQFLHFIRTALWMSLHIVHFSQALVKINGKQALRAGKLFEGTICAIFIRHCSLHQSCQWTHHNWMQEKIHSFTQMNQISNVVLDHFLPKPGNIYKIKQSTVSFFCNSWFLNLTKPSPFADWQKVAAEDSVSYHLVVESSVEWQGEQTEESNISNARRADHSAVNTTHVPDWVSGTVTALTRYILPTDSGSLGVFTRVRTQSLNLNDSRRGTISHPVQSTPVCAILLELRYSGLFYAPWLDRQWPFRYESYLVLLPIKTQPLTCYYQHCLAGWVEQYRIEENKIALLSLCKSNEIECSVFNWCLRIRKATK